MMRQNLYTPARNGVGLTVDFKANNPFVAVLASLFLTLTSACTTTENLYSNKVVDSNISESKQKPETESDAEDDWSQMKPGLKRLLLIESDLKLLMAELSETSFDEGDDNPSTDSIPFDNVSLPAIELPSIVVGDEESSQDATDTKLTISARNAGKAETRQFGLLIAQNTSKKALVRWWKSKRRELSPLLDDLHPLITNEGLNGGSMFRLRAGPYAGFSAAKEACNKLKQSGSACKLSGYFGKRL